ncbi:MAG: hypothetical protein ACYTFW_22945, partial [Planctomycetota bacterium]
MKAAKKQSQFKANLKRRRPAEISRMERIFSIDLPGRIVRLMLRNGSFIRLQKNSESEARNNVE